MFEVLTMSNIYYCNKCKNNCSIEIVNINSHAYYSGYKCSKGLSDAKSHLNQEDKILTARAILTNAKMSTIPVRTTDKIPFSLIPDAIKIIENTKVKAPIEKGTVIIENILDTGINVVTLRKVL